jgi:hypothetical protein
MTFFLATFMSRFSLLFFVICLLIHKVCLHNFF